MYSKLELVTVYAVVASKSVKNRFCEKNIQICSMVWMTWAASHSYPIFLGMFPEEWPRKILPTFSSREVTLGEMRKIGIHFITYPWNRTKKNQSPQTSTLLCSTWELPATENCHVFCQWSMPEMSTDQNWIRTEANFGRIRTGSDCNFFENWRIRTGSDWKNLLFWCDYSNHIKHVSCNVILQIG